MPMLECPQLAELDLEPVAGASSFPHQHAPVPSVPGAPAEKMAITKPKYNVRKAPKVENNHPHLGVRPITRFKQIISPESTWMTMAMDIQAQAQQHLHHQQQQQQQNIRKVEDHKIKVPTSMAMEIPKSNNESRRYYPAPYCSCTGANQQCYRWGNGGWQSACCTTKISVYPLPMNPKKKGSRVAGRKMSAGAFRKLLDRLSAEGVDVNLAVDLRPHWAKHGTNRYVTIK